MNMKEAYRKKYIDIRKNIKNRQELDTKIYKKTIENKHINDCNLILIYVSRKDEIDTLNLIEYFLNKNKQIAVPKIENNRMNFYYIESINDLKLGTFKVLEPTTKKKVTIFDNTVSITPGICFSYDRHRIGYGKGYYDKFYQKYPHIYKIGLCYEECYLKEIPHDEYDIKVDEIITP